ncbi:hypothetical protein [Ekhidna sp.]|uniref:hypothetical protein n=1 Tax=Ekhidna sp. TaxID=2608089 RepID=UPI003C7C1BCD
MRFTITFSFFLTFLICNAQVTETEQIDISTIKEDLSENGKNSEYYKNYYVFECNALDSTFNELMSQIEPNFIDSLKLDEDYYGDDFPQFLTDYLSTHIQNYNTSCSNLRELFNDTNCLTKFLKQLLGTDYKESVELSSVIYNGDKATFSVYGDFWSSVYWIRLTNKKLEVAILSSVIE